MSDADVLSDPIFVTVCTRDYLPRAITLADSLADHHPHARLKCYLVDVDDPPASETMEVMGIQDIGVPHLPSFRFQYEPFELCCALKPYVLLHLLACSSRPVIYLDADTYVLADLWSPFQKAWETGDVVLTPHILRPERALLSVFYLTVGSVNAGVLGVKPTALAVDFLTWWKDRLDTLCYNDFRGGVFVDQGWLGLAPALFPRVVCLSSLDGVNIAHWNLGEFDFVTEKGRLMIGPEAPLRLFHFSGFTCPGLTRHESILGTVPPVIEELAAEYQARWQSARERVPHMEPFPLRSYSDGNTIPPVHREVVRRGLFKAENPFEEREAIARLCERLPKEELHRERVDWRIKDMEDEQRRLERLLEEAHEGYAALWKAHVNYPLRSYLYDRYAFVRVMIDFLKSRRRASASRP